MATEHQLARELRALVDEFDSTQEEVNGVYAGARLGVCAGFLECDDAQAEPFFVTADARRHLELLKREIGDKVEVALEIGIATADGLVERARQILRA